MSSHVALPLIGVVLALLAGAQKADEGARDAAAYLALVERYRADPAGEAVVAIAGWRDEDLEAVLDDLPGSFDSYRDALPAPTRDAQDAAPGLQRNARAPTPLELLSAAMMLHTTAARRARGPEIERQLLFARRLSHLGATLERNGQQISLLSPNDERRTRFSARWHVLGGTILLGSQDVQGAAAHVDIAQRLRPDDPVVLLAAGSLHEACASPLAAQVTGPGPRARRGEPAPDRDSHLQHARDLYARSLALDPDRLEAVVRYGRVLGLLGHHDDAAAQLSRVLESPVTGNLRYFALMVSGSIEQSRGHRVEAVANFAAARQLCRRCQSATLALSQARLGSGDRTGARALVEELLTQSRWRVPSDPWWVYHRGQWHAVDEMLEEVVRLMPR